MNIEYSKEKIVLKRELSVLDKFVIDFVRILDKHNIKYVLVSGYVSIVFGRSRQTEDVDMIISKMPYQEFENLWGDLTKEFECMNTDDPIYAYKNFLNDYAAIRFFRSGFPLPNMEFKFGKTPDDIYSLNNFIEFFLSGNKLIISQLEFHIAYKFYLGSEKDLEDAKFIFDLFKGKIDIKKLKEHFKKLNIDSNTVKEYLGFI